MTYPTYPVLSPTDLFERGYKLAAHFLADNWSSRRKEYFEPIKHIPPHLMTNPTPKGGEDKQTNRQNDQAHLYAL